MTAEPHHRGHVDLPDDCWDWLDRTAARDGTRAESNGGPPAVAVVAS